MKGQRHTLKKAEILLYTLTYYPKSGPLEDVKQYRMNVNFSQSSKGVLLSFVLSLEIMSETTYTLSQLIKMYCAYIVIPWHMLILLESPSIFKPLDPLGVKIRQ